MPSMKIYLIGLVLGIGVGVVVTMIEEGVVDDCSRHFEYNSGLYGCVNLS